MKVLSVELRDRPIDILLSNAGIYGPWGLGFGEVDPAQWREVLEVNSIAPLMLVQSFVEQACRQRERRKAASLLNSTVTPLPGEAQSGVS